MSEFSEFEKLTEQEKVRMLCEALGVELVRGWVLREAGKWIGIDIDEGRARAWAKTLGGNVTVAEEIHNPPKLTVDWLLELAKGLFPTVYLWETAKGNWSAQVGGAVCDAASNPADALAMALLRFQGVEV